MSAAELLIVQVVARVRCPVCRGERLKNNGRPRGGPMRFYACLEPSCAARFKVRVIDPLAPVPGAS